MKMKKKDAMQLKVCKFDEDTSIEITDFYPMVLNSYLSFLTFTFQFWGNAQRIKLTKIPICVIPLKTLDIVILWISGISN